jgi:hypothetical protein
VKRRRPQRGAIAGTVLVLLLSGCGGSKKTSSTATTASQTATHPVTSIPAPTPATALEPGFIARANAVCARAKRALDAKGQFPYHSFDPLHPDVKLLPKVGAFFAARRAIGDRVPEELGALGTPKKAAGQWAQMVALSKQDRAIADRQIKAAEASDAPAFVATVNAIAATDERLGKLALSGGFSQSSPCTAIL